MRSKTTVGGPSLSACLVIALGGGKKKRRERGWGGQAVAALETGVCAVWSYTGSRPVDSSAAPPLAE